LYFGEGSNYGGIKLSLCRIKYLVLSSLVFSLIFITCEQNKTPLKAQDENNEEPDYFTRTISGYVHMEHQTNHDNCAVFLDSVNIGTYTDSSGFYSLTLADPMFNSDTLLLQGRFKLYFYSFNYELDSSYVAVGSKGFIKDSLAIDARGHVKNMLVKQVLSIKLVTDTTYYAVGDTIWMTMYMKKFGTDTIEIKIIESYPHEIGPVFILNTLPHEYYVAQRMITLQSRYIWSDSTVTIELFGAWPLFKNFFSYFNYPVGHYTLIPYILKSDSNIPRWWRLPENLERFLPPTQFINSDYLYHPKKFDTPIIYLDSVQTK
jgi:hypothetical protein